jgi:ScaI restriction endonuclease
MSKSPYLDQQKQDWLQITERLVKTHPLESNLILDAVLTAWNTLWETRIGAGENTFPLQEMALPAQVTGFFFEKLLATVLKNKTQEKWRGGTKKFDKDLVFLEDPQFSIELKTSGQLGLKLFGNRSYGKQIEENLKVDKVDRAGYFITVNFYGSTLSLIRFGWIDHEDWVSQKSETGQAATLKEDTYTYKLIAILGDYQQSANVGILKGVGAKMLESLHDQGIETIAQLLNYSSADSKIEKLKRIAIAWLQSGRFD